MKFWNDVKNWVIKTRGLEADATDAEVHQAVLDAQAEGNSPDEVVDTASTAKAATTTATTTATTAATTTTATEENASETVSIAEFNALKAELATTKAKLSALAKSSKSSAVATATETTATEPTKKRAYMSTPLNKGLYDN